MKDEKRREEIEGRRQQLLVYDSVGSGNWSFRRGGYLVTEN